LQKKSIKNSQTNNIPVALTIAGSDPSSGAGVQADLKTYWYHNVYGLSVITAITVQNTTGVKEVFALPAHLIASQLDFIFSDISVHSVKIGMVFSKDTAKEVSFVLKRHNVKNIVLDPIILSTSGNYLIKKDEIKDIVDYLFPISYIITPNAIEALELTGIHIKDEKDVNQVLSRLKELGPQNILLKGGHLPGKLNGIDFFYNGLEVQKFYPEKIINSKKPIHGTGCILSSAISANLAKGKDIYMSIKDAKSFITKIIDKKICLGKGSYLWI